MKNKIIIFSVIIAVLGIGLLVAWEAFSYKTIQFNLKSSEYTVNIFNKEDKQVSTVSNSGQIKLKEGDYNYRVNGEKYDTTRVNFSVAGNETVIEIDPQYSQEYLLGLLEEERSLIGAILSSTYSSQNYTIQSLKLYQKGQWAAGTLTLTTDPRQLPDTYRFVLQKVNDIWTLIASPQIAISKAEYKDIPESILYSLYN